LVIFLISDNAGKKMKLKRTFYLGDDVVSLAREVIGKYLFTRIHGILTGGYITEAEAYAGITDRASHAWNGRRTARTEVMYREGGTAYVYLCYGIHSLFNIVTNQAGVPHAILIRGIHPTHGMEAMLQRSGKTKLNPGLARGPGKVAKILGITTAHSGIDLLGDEIWLEDRNLDIPEGQVEATRRIGIDYAETDALRPYRFVLIQKNPG
jgi:DNA-3-methyladenine glycosylase